jgi:hypothetical protein
LILTPRLDGNAPFKFTDGSGLPEKAMFASSDKGTITLYFFGRFTYEDVFGKPRFTAFCFVHNPGSKPISVHRYGSFNEAD